MTLSKDVKKSLRINAHQVQNGPQHLQIARLLAGQGGPRRAPNKWPNGLAVRTAKAEVTKLRPVAAKEERGTLV
jgi:hypothetical protein